MTSTFHSIPIIFTFDAMEDLNFVHFEMFSLFIRIKSGLSIVLHASCVAFQNTAYPKEYEVQEWGARNYRFGWKSLKSFAKFQSYYIETFINNDINLVSSSA